MNKKQVFSNNLRNLDLVRSEWVQYEIMENFNEEIKQQIAKEVRRKYSDLDIRGELRGYLKKHDPIRYHRCYFNPVSCFGHFVKNERNLKKRSSRFSIR